MSGVMNMLEESICLKTFVEWTCPQTTNAGQEVLILQDSLWCYQCFRL